MAQAPYKAGASSALHNGRTWKRLMRIERAVQLQATGQFKDSEIAEQIGITPAMYSLIKQTPEFKQRMIAAATGVISQNDLAVKTNAEYQAELLKQTVPVALARLATMVMSRNENIALKAVAEILDRDGNHAKVSRTNVEIKDTRDKTLNDPVANNILDILAGRTSYQSNHEEVTTVMDEFTKGAADADAAIKNTAEFVNDDTLSQIDGHRPTIN